MTKLVANLGLIAFGQFIMLGNFWFTYGVWPRSWTSFVLFSFASMLLIGMRMGMEREK